MKGILLFWIAAVIFMISAQARELLVIDRTGPEPCRGTILKIK